MRLLRESLFGVDVSPTACRITAFSLYLAYLDQLDPPDIPVITGERSRALPRLVASVARGAAWGWRGCSQYSGGRLLRRLDECDPD